MARAAIKLLAGLASDKTKILAARVLLKFLKSLSTRIPRQTKLESAQIQPRFEFKLLIAIPNRLAENGLQRLRRCGVLAAARVQFGGCESRRNVGGAIAGVFGKGQGISCGSLGVADFRLGEQSSCQKSSGLARIGGHRLLLKLRGRRANQRLGLGWLALLDRNDGKRNLALRNLNCVAGL